MRHDLVRTVRGTADNNLALIWASGIPISGTEITLSRKGLMIIQNLPCVILIYVLILFLTFPPGFVTVPVLRERQGGPPPVERLTNHVF